MGPSMNLQPHQAGDLAGINGHNLRRPGHTSASFDPALSAHNYMLDQSMTDWTPPAGQPDTGRKIRTDARVAASFVMTLPEEIDPEDGPKLDAWIDATMDWWNSLPGKPAYAVMHMDEPKARPHIHALRIPENEAGNLNYKRDFGGHRERLDEMQESYALALEPLGVFMAHEEDRKKRRSARKEPEEPEPEQRRTRRRPKTRAPETPRADLEADLKTARNQVQQQAEQNRQLNTALENTKKKVQTAEEKRKQAQEKAETAETERNQAQKALNQQQASADLKTLKPPKRYSQEERASHHAAKAFELDDLSFDDTEKATPGESGQTENKEDYQDSKAELQDKTKTPREKEKAGADLITSLPVRDAPAELERVAPAEQERAALTETLKQTNQNNSQLTATNTALQSELTAERSAHRATKETLNNEQKGGADTAESEVNGKKTDYIGLAKMYNELMTTYNKLLDQCRPWLRLVDMFKKTPDPQKEAETVLKGGLIYLGYVEPPALPEQDREDEGPVAGG